MSIKITDFFGKVQKRNINPSKDQSKKVLLGNCRCVTDFKKLNRVGEGTYGVV